MIPLLVVCALVTIGYLLGRIHSWFLELIWRDAAGKRLRAVATAERATNTAAAIADVLEMSSGGDR